MSKPYQSPVLRQLIQSTLQPLNIYSDDACELLLATCAQESHFGTYREQMGGGPAKGIFQMEGEDYSDIWTNYLAYHADLANQIKQLSTVGTVDDLINNDPYAIVMARVHYMRQPGKLPQAKDLSGMYDYYKAHYNTANGGATQLEFYDNYKYWVTDGQVD